MSYYVYILVSEVDSSKYIGVTKDLIKRVKEHNSKGNKFTTRKQPYYLKWYCIFDNKKKAYEFEKYLKSSSGHAFMNKRFI